MSRIQTYLLCLFAVACWLCGCNTGNAVTRIPDLRETYSRSDKKPFGAYIAYHLVEEMFFRNTIHNENVNFRESWKNIDDTAGIYICMAPSLYTTTEDVNSIIAFAEKGNDAFFAARGFDDNLLTELGCKIDYGTKRDGINGKWYGITVVQMRANMPADTGIYRYFYFPFNTKFISYNKACTRVLGYNENGDADFIVVFRGKGRIFLHCEPRAFSNYFLLQKNNFQYMEKAFGYLNDYPGHVYWNNYYARIRSKEQALNNRNRPGSFNSLDEIMKHPPLAAAFWICLAMLLLYIFFGIKRRQRILEIVKPIENTTVTFTETIGRLYLQQKNNKNIADKMITYFNEYIRNNYFLNTQIINTGFITTLSRKSGVPFNRVESLYRAMDHANHQVEIDDFQLLSLNVQIQEFFKGI